MALGLWLIVLPYLGIPGSWRTVLLILSGIVIAGTGFFLRSEALARSHKRSAHRPFVENMPAGQAGAQDAYHDRPERIDSLN